MTRRVTLLLVAVVAAALLLAGAGTLVLAGVEDRREARGELEDQAEDAAALLAFVGRRLPNTLPSVRRVLRVDGVVVVPVDEVPGLSPREEAKLRAGGAVSWTDGSHVRAAAVSGRRPGEAVLVSRDVPLLAPELTRWLVVVSLVTLVVAALVGRWLSRRTLRPLRAVDAATRRIAAGDLGARVEVPGDGDELAELARSVNSMAESIERSRELERLFLMSVSHDLRTPLTSIRGFAEAVADGAAPDPGHAATVILAESRRLERLVADLLELAKLDARQFSLHLEPVELTEVVETAAEAFRPAFDEEGVRLDVELRGPAPVTADYDRVGQVVANLVENALKHAVAEVRVEAFATEGGGGTLAVSDDGAGILPEDVPHVFERLYAGRRPARREVGSGLGLAIVAELVAAMGGTVECRSTPGEGTAMSVHLPPARQNR
jgi:two-component system sensor histidine kinase BaeS